MINGRYHNILTVADIFGNVTLLILGMCLLGLGMAEKSTPVATLFAAESNIGTFGSTIGLMLIFSSLLNCCFAVNENNMLGYLYVGVLSALLILSILLAIIYGIPPESYIKQDVRMRMRKLVRFRPNSLNETELDSIQYNFECCGVDTYKDWFYLTGDHIVPQSCCIKSGCDSADTSNIFSKSCLTQVLESTTSLLEKIAGALIVIITCLPIQISIVSLLIMCYN